MFNFLLDNAAGGGNALANAVMYLFFLAMIAMLVFSIINSIRSKKKEQQEYIDMKNSLAVGDEITTLGGIIGKVVSIKEDTFVLETTKDRTKIRFLKGAIRSIDVKIADVAAAQVENAEKEVPTEKEEK